MRGRSSRIARSPRSGRGLPVVLAAAVVLSACGAGEDAAGVDTVAATETAAAPATVTPAPPPPSPPEPPPGYSPPDDWYERALESADAARRAVVAIGWDPPGVLLRRIEAGWLIAPDLVITSDAVACDVREGRDLRVRTFDGTIVSATVEEIVGSCGGWEPGVARIRLSRAVDAPTLRLRPAGAPEAGEPLMAIGHANHAAAVGGWLVMVGPMAETQGDLLLADIGAPVIRWRFDEWFGGGSNGAPVIDLAGDVVAVLCCERDWGPQLRYDDAFAEPVLRRRLTIDGRYHVAGLWGEALRRAIGPAAG
jgi:hypothetical protein